MIIDPDIERLLHDFRPAVINSTEETIYAMRPDFTLAYVNRGWQRFAALNGGEPSISSNWPIGCCVQNAIPVILRPFFAKNFAKCLQENRPWGHRYECSSAELNREFFMTTYPLGKRAGFLVVNSLIREASHSRIAHEALDALYRNEHGFIIQCCHCRRVRRCGSTAIWDWVPAWVKTFPPNTSHGLCEPCYGFYYPSSTVVQGGRDEAFRTQ